MLNNSGKMIPEFTKRDVESRFVTWLSGLDWLAWLFLTLVAVLGIYALIQGLILIGSAAQETETMSSPTSRRRRGILWIIAGTGLLSVATIAALVIGLVLSS